MPGLPTGDFITATGNVSVADEDEEEEDDDDDEDCEAKESTLTMRLAGSMTCLGGDACPTPDVALAGNGHD